MKLEKRLGSPVSEGTQVRVHFFCVLRELSKDEAGWKDSHLGQLPWSLSVCQPLRVW